MSGMVGADLDEMAELARAFDHASAELKRVEWLAASRLFIAEWAGADVDDIRFQWNNGCRQGLRAAAESLGIAAQQTREQAEQQRRASDAGWYYARSIADNRGLGDRWNDLVHEGRSIVDDVAGATGDLVVGVGALIGTVAGATGQALVTAGEKVVDAVEWLGERTLEVASWAGGVIAGVTGTAIDTAVNAGVWAGRTAHEVVDGVRHQIGRAWDWTKDVALPFALLTAYDAAVRGPFGELLENTAGVVEVDSTLDESDRHLNVDSIYENMNRLKGSGHIEVQSVVGPDGATRYVVYIPGTQNWTFGTNNPADVMSDLEYEARFAEGSVIGGDTPLSIAVEKAMAAAGVPQGAEIILAGHSLGGLTAVQLSWDPDFTSRYSLQAVITAGAGTDSTPPPPGVKLEALRHYDDPVSGLNGSNPLPSGIPGQHEHWSWEPITGPISTHVMGNYLDDSGRLESENAFAQTEQALPEFFGPGAVVDGSQGFEARKLPFIGDDPRVSQLPTASQAARR